jgi:hypothetical protein
LSAAPLKHYVDPNGKIYPGNLRAQLSAAPLKLAQYVSDAVLGGLISALN